MKSMKRIVPVMKSTTKYNPIQESTFIYNTQCKLELILKKSKINHVKEILKNSSIKYAHIYCLINNINGPKAGTLIERYIQEKYQMKKIKSSDCKGDMLYKGINIEIKSSIGGHSHNKFNYVQIRLNHVCDYILTAYYLSNENVKELGKMYIFRLSKSEIKNIIELYGSYAHGSVKKTWYY